MQTATTIQRMASTFLVHYFGAGLDHDDRFVVERFRSMADGEIRPVDDGRGKGRRRQRKIVSRRTVKGLRPARDEVIIATGVSSGGGRQVWGEHAAGLVLRGRWR